MSECEGCPRCDNHYGYCTLDPHHDGPCAPVPEPDMSEQTPTCGDADYQRCPECQAHKTEPHLEPCSLRPTPVLTGCSIDSHDSRLDHCLEGHDEPNGGNPYFVCDKYDLPYKEAK